MSPRQLKLPIAGLLEKARLRVHVFVLRLFVIKARLRDQHRVRAILHHLNVLNFNQFRLQFRHVSRRHHPNHDLFTRRVPAWANEPRVLGNFRDEFFFVRDENMMFLTFSQMAYKIVFAKEVKTYVFLYKRFEH